MAKRFKILAALGPLLLLATVNGVSACPLGCVCELKYSKKLPVVTCDGPAILSFPTDIATNTVILTIRSTSINQIPQNAFAKLVNLQLVSLTENKQLRELPAGLFDNLDKLVRIVVNYNNFTTIPTGLFKNLPHLEKIFLKTNGLTHLSRSVFRNLPKLELINLENNQLASVPSELFGDSMPNLKQLYIGHNRLSNLPHDFLRPISKSLSSLRLENNLFQKMPVKALKVLENLNETLAVHGNPLYCNCSLKAFSDWVNKMKIEITAGGISCSNGVETSLLNLNLSHCAPEIETTATPSSKPSTPPSAPSSTSTSKPSTSTPTSSKQTPKLTSTLFNSLPTLPASTSRTILESSPPKHRSPSSGDSDTHDASEDNQKRKMIILAVSISVVAVVVLLALIFCLFHTGILQSRCMSRFEKNKMIVYDAEGKILVKDGYVVT